MQLVLSWPGPQRIMHEPPWSGISEIQQYKILEKKVFKERVLCVSVWPQASYVEAPDPPASTSQVLRLEVWATMPGFHGA